MEHGYNKSKEGRGLWTEEDTTRTPQHLLTHHESVTRTRSLGTSKISETQVPIAVLEEYVSRLHVAVNEPARMEK